MHFDFVGRHLLAALQADHVDFLVAADAQGRARHVVGHVLVMRAAPAERATS